MGVIRRNAKIIRDRSFRGDFQKRKPPMHRTERKVVNMAAV
jgi:hypothetical protein